jgi:hypothetical protein
MAREQMWTKLADRRPIDSICADHWRSCSNTPNKKPTADKLRRWRITIIRQRAHHLGTVEAPDQKSAEAQAVKLFDLNDEQRKRLSIWEWRWS